MEWKVRSVQEERDGGEDTNELWTSKAFRVIDSLPAQITHPKSTTRKMTTSQTRFFSPIQFF